MQFFQHIEGHNSTNYVDHIDCSTGDGGWKGESSTRNVVGVDYRHKFGFLTQFTLASWGSVESFWEGWGLWGRKGVTSNRGSKRGKLSVGY